MELKKYNRGRNPASLQALQENRSRALEVKRKNKEVRLMKEELEKEEKRRQILNLEIELFKIRKKREEDEEYKIQYERQFYPLSQQQLNRIIKNVFLNFILVACFNS